MPALSASAVPVQVALLFGSFGQGEIAPPLSSSGETTSSDESLLQGCTAAAPSSRPCLLHLGKGLPRHHGTCADQQASTSLLHNHLSCLTFCFALWSHTLRVPLQASSSHQLTFWCPRRGWQQPPCRHQPATSRGLLHLWAPSALSPAVCPERLLRQCQRLPLLHWPPTSSLLPLW